MTASELTRLPAVMPPRRASLMIEEFGSQFVVLVPEDRMAHHLDEGMSLVLDSCDGVTPTADVLLEVARATGEDPALVGNWLANSLDELRRRGMLAPGALE